MAQYAPVYFEADTLSDATSAAVTGGQLLYVSGDNTVAPTTGATAGWVGVAAFDADNGTRVTYSCEGVHDLASSGTINAGDVVIPAAGRCSRGDRVGHQLRAGRRGCESRSIRRQGASATALMRLLARGPGSSLPFLAMIARERNTGRMLPRAHPPGAAAGYGSAAP